MIVDYDEAWPRHFSEVKDCLERILAEHIQSVEHVGSTSVPGIVAKPIIDIHVVVRDDQEMGQVVESLAVLGYVHEGDGGIPGRERFRRKGPDVPFLDPKRDWYPHHLYASLEGAVELERHLTFRDHLRKDEADREAYAELKRSLVAEHGYDREAYQEGKTDFIEAVLARAGEATGGE